MVQISSVLLWPYMATYCMCLLCAYSTSVCMYTLWLVRCIIQCASHKVCGNIVEQNLTLTCTVQEVQSQTEFKCRSGFWLVLKHLHWLSIPQRIPAQTPSLHLQSPPCWCPLLTHRPIPLLHSFPHPPCLWCLPLVHHPGASTRFGVIQSCNAEKVSLNSPIHVGLNVLLYSTYLQFYCVLVFFYLLT